MKRSLLTRKEKKILYFIVFFVILTRILLAFRSEEAIYTRPFFDDSFYVFNCAEHVANGSGFSVDGIHPTNGVQPLIVIIYTPLFLIAGTDKLLALKLSFILIAFFDALSVIFIALIVRLLQKKIPDEPSRVFSPPIIAAILWAGLYPIMVHTANGLETGLYSSLLLATFFYYMILLRQRKESVHIGLAQWILLGFLAGITVLARIDAVFLVGAITLNEFILLKRKGLGSGVIISLAAFIVSSPWWWYNYHVFGSVMPQSGYAESLDTALWANFPFQALSMGDLLTLFFILPNYAFPSWFEFSWFVAIVALVFLIVKKFHLRKYLSESYDLVLIRPWLIFCLSLLVFYVLFFGAPYYLPRYLHPLRILYLILFACSLPAIVRSSRVLYTNGKKIALSACYILGICAMIFSGARYISLFVREGFNNLYHVGKWALVHPKDHIGMAQSGLAGYIAPNVVNLDGKVNFEALQANQHHAIGSYIESKKLDYLADWREIVGHLVFEAANYGGRFEKFDSIGRVIIFKRVEK